MMVFMSLLPAGIYQAWASVTQGPVVRPLAGDRAFRRDGDPGLAARSGRHRVCRWRRAARGLRSEAPAPPARAGHATWKRRSPRPAAETPMKLTTFTDYSLRVLMYLGLQKDRRATIAEIATVFGMSEHHLTKVVHFLGKNGWLANMRGKCGGLALAVLPGQIRVGDVVRQTEGDSLASSASSLAAATAASLRCAGCMACWTRPSRLSTRCWTATRWKTFCRTAWNWHRCCCRPRACCRCAVQPACSQLILDSVVRFSGSQAQPASFFLARTRAYVPSVGQQPRLFDPRPASSAEPLPTGRFARPVCAAPHHVRRPPGRSASSGCRAAPDSWGIHAKAVLGQSSWYLLNRTQPLNSHGR